MMPSQPSNDSAAEQAEFPVPTGIVPFPVEGQQALVEAMAHGYARERMAYDRQLEQYNAPDRPVWLSKPQLPQPVDGETFQALFDYVSGESDGFHSSRSDLQRYAWTMEPLGDWFAPSQVQLIHVVRLAHALRHLNLHQRETGGAWLRWTKSHDLEQYRRRSGGAFGLRELSTALQELPDVTDDTLGEAWLVANSGYNTLCDWEPAAIWPYFGDHVDLLERHIAGKSLPSMNNRLAQQIRAAAFRVLSLFPALPERIVPVLWEMALGEQKSLRGPAQQALASVPNKHARIAEGMQDGRQAVRAAAAEWLGELGDVASLNPLREAFLKEKQEVVKGALIQALDRIGADVNEFLDRKLLLQEAERGLKKKRPKGTEWLPLELLPELTWSDTGERVDPAIVGWWVVQCVTRKSIVPGPLIQRYLQLCQPSEVARLARFLLSSWIGEDTQTLPHAEAAELARREAGSQWQHSYTRQHFKTEQDLCKTLLSEYSSRFTGSAIGQKGLLSLVAIGGDRDAVRLIEQYLRKWFGHRLAQCKALIEVLAWIDDPAAIQALFAVSSRFRTKALQKVAAGHVQSLAERRGWTLEELADRTLPDGGFTREPLDEGTSSESPAQLVLDYGPRTFTVTLTDDLQLRIANSEGKVIKNLPSAGKQDDPELVKEAKKALSEARKTVRELTKRQTERFYEAVCTQRLWPVKDWKRDLRQHPIVGRLCTRLVWMAVRAPEANANAGEPLQVVSVFRPLEDGSFTDQNDQPVELASDVRICLAHTCSLPAGQESAWVEHLADYDVQPLFAQFGRESITLTPEMRDATDVMTYQGHMLTTFRLRSKATRLNWGRGEPQDAGAFWWYTKSFPTLQLAARLEFTGSYLPEEDIPAALRTFYFVPLGEEGEPAPWDSPKLPIGRVPPVLLSEIFADVQSIAAEGTGFDPTWEQRGLW